MIVQRKGILELLTAVLLGVQVLGARLVQRATTENSVSLAKAVLKTHVEGKIMAFA